MRYILLNLTCLGLLFYSTQLSGIEEEVEEVEVDSEETQNYVPDYDKIASEVQRDAEIHTPWGGY